MDEAEVLAVLESSGAILRGHFLLSSGRHSDVYVEKFRALEQPGIAARLGEALASRFVSDSPDVVLSPAVGAIILGHTTALAVGSRFVFAERQDGVMTLRRGFRIEPGERVVVVEDVITTGASVLEVISLVGDGSLLGVGALVDRSDGDFASHLGARFESLVRIGASSWPPDECPLCRAGGVPASPGSHYLGTGSGRERSLSDDKHAGRGR